MVSQGLRRGSFGQRFLFRKVRSLEILEILDSPQSVEKGEADNYLETLENLETLEILKCQFSSLNFVEDSGVSLAKIS